MRSWKRRPSRWSYSCWKMRAGKPLQRRRGRGGGLGLVFFLFCCLGWVGWGEGVQGRARLRRQPLGSPPFCWGLGRRCIFDQPAVQCTRWEQPSSSSGATRRNVHAAQQLLSVPAGASRCVPRAPRLREMVNLRPLRSCALIFTLLGRCNGPEAAAAVRPSSGGGTRQAAGPPPAGKLERGRPQGRPASRRAPAAAHLHIRIDAWEGEAALLKQVPALARVDDLGVHQHNLQAGREAAAWSAGQHVSRSRLALRCIHASMAGEKTIPLSRQVGPLLPCPAFTAGNMGRAPGRKPVLAWLAVTRAACPPDPATGYPPHLLPLALLPRLVEHHEPHVDAHLRGGQAHAVVPARHGRRAATAPSVCLAGPAALTHTRAWLDPRPGVPTPGRRSASCHHEWLSPQVGLPSGVTKQKAGPHSMSTTHPTPPHPAPAAHWYMTSNISSASFRSVSSNTPMRAFTARSRGSGYCSTASGACHSSLVAAAGAGGDAQAGVREACCCHGEGLRPFPRGSGVWQNYHIHHWVIGQRNQQAGAPRMACMQR